MCTADDSITPLDRRMGLLCLVSAHFVEVVVACAHTVWQGPCVHCKGRRCAVHKVTQPCVWCAAAGATRVRYVCARLVWGDCDLNGRVSLCALHALGKGDNGVICAQCALRSRGGDGSGGEEDGGSGRSAAVYWCCHCARLCSVVCCASVFSWVEHAPRSVERRQ